jgi:hypothetical protein
MAKAKVTSQDFLKNLELEETPAPGGEGAAEEGRRTRTRQNGVKGFDQQGRKHIGGYLDPEMSEQFAVLKIRLNLDNSQLIERAIGELFRREIAAKQFGDR